MTSPDFSKNPYGQAPPPGYGQAPPPAYGQPPYAQYGQPPYGQYGQAPYGFAAVQKPTGWFVVNWLFFWPLAIYSLTSAWGNIDRALFVGDINGAQYQANRVKKFGIIALCIGIGWIALWLVIVVAVGASTSASYCHGYNC
ncbi:CD225/dispanin family protein [uncultured Jatrophihabitans sp.]|uniref:CD225/dispanin family protein n=1 Tax=uncultured Jatrophihabitans sp. TaxID=1610747 RepID=UPI0035CA585B